MVVKERQRRHLIRKIIIAGWIAALFVLGVALFSVYKIQNFIRDSRLVEERHHFQALLEGILSGMREAESAQRGFLVVEEVDLYKPYYEAKVKTYVHFTKAHEIAREDEFQLYMLDSLKVLMDERFTLLEQVTRLDSISRRNTELKQRLILEGYATTETFRNILTEVSEYGERKLEQSLSESKQSSFEAIIVIIIFSCIAIVIVIASFSRITRELIVRTEVEYKLKRNERMLIDAERLSHSGSFRWEFPHGTLDWSDGTFAVYDIPSDFEVTYENFLQLVHPDDRQNLEDFIKEIQVTKTSREVKYRIIRYSDNQIRTINAHVFVVLNEYDQSIEALVGSIRDITESEIITASLIKLNEDLSKSNEELERFAYVASHDLQEPLRKISAFSDRLVAKYGKEELPGQEYITRMQNAALRMQTLIDDLLAYSRVSRNIGPKKQVDLNEVIEEVMDDLSITVKEKNAKIKVETLPTISGNKIQMHQLFQNLISNAIKFNRPETTPMVTITHEIMDVRKIKSQFRKTLVFQQDHHVIKVADNGIGFDQKKAEQIFTIFQRLHGRGQYKGTGIGLAICKRIVENHQGQISAQSTTGEGSAFFIFLPVTSGNDENSNGMDPVEENEFHIQPPPKN